MGRGDDISIQISLYPLGDTDITRNIMEFLQIFESYGLRYDMGSMSTVITGQTSAMFTALEEAYRYVAQQNRFVLVCTMSNAVPTEKDLEQISAPGRK